ncbi:MAG: polyprenyl synthetase family protein [Actinocrinis sp.]
MRGLGSLRPRVDGALDAFMAARIAEAGGAAAPPTDPREVLSTELSLVTAIGDLLSRGGKRLRAALCVLGWAGAGGAVDEAIVRAGASLELLHACALIHDDVMDRSATRRGGVSVHQGFAARHESAGWRGDAAQFGVGAAVVAGDLCMVWADELLRESALPSAALERGRALYDAMRAETIRGQYLDLAAQARGRFSIDEALAVARAKTAACTTTGPLCFGGALAGADDGLMAAYEAYGVALGVAFQLRDDLLGAFADPAATGKPSGDDLRDGKCTVLLAETYQRLDSRGRTRLAELIGEGSDDAVDRLRALVESVGARAAVEERIAGEGKRAVEALSARAMEQRLDPGVREVLVSLVATVTEG